MKNYIEKSMTFAEYIKLIDDLLLDGKTTGAVQSDAMFDYGKLNSQRMHRLEKTVNLEESLKETVRNLNVKWIWLVITEGWCGDAAQNIPVIEKIATENEGIETRYVLRDENLELMDEYLTGGARSIPKLICLDAETLKVIGTWGARPDAAQKLFYEMKAQNLAKSLLMENLQRWYLADKNQSIQMEFAELIEQWADKKESAAVR